MSSVQDDTAPVALSTLGKHVHTVYDLLDQDAKDEQLGQDRLRIFRGSFLSVYKSASVSMSYYGPIRKILVDVGSISQLQQGSRNVDSVIILHGRPDAEVVDELAEKELTTPEARNIRIERELHEIKQMIGGLNIPEALTHLQLQINELKGKK